MVQLDLPQEFLDQVKGLNFFLWLQLTATKIGCSKSLQKFRDKLSNLMVLLPFGVKYIAICHHCKDKRVPEDAAHYIFDAFHISGEWFDLEDRRRQYLISKYPNCEILDGVLKKGNLNMATPQADISGWVYVFRYDWSEVEMNTIQTILHNSQSAETRETCMDLLAAKIGSSVDLPKRLSNMIWAACFAKIKYTAFRHNHCRTREKELHNNFLQQQVGGEWFHLLWEWKPHVWSGNDVECLYVPSNHLQSIANMDGWLERCYGTYKRRVGIGGMKLAF